MNKSMVKAVPWALNKGDLGYGYSQLVLIMLAHLHDLDNKLPLGKVQVTHATLREITGISRAALINYLNFLEGTEEIKIERCFDGKRQLANTYTLRLDRK